jgi:transposase
LFWKLHTGAQSRDIPERYGPWSTIYDRYLRWCQEGRFAGLLVTLRQTLDAEGLLDWEQWWVDSSQIRASRAAGARRGGGPKNEPGNHALGRSRGGFGTKLHLLCDRNGLVLSALLLAGQAPESPQFEALLESSAVKRASGRTRRRPRRVGADRAYHAQRIRHWLRAHGIGAVIPARRSRKKPESGRPVSSDRARYGERTVIERCISWLKECRSVATRYEKLAVHYLGMVHLAIIERYLKLLAQRVPGTWNPVVVQNLGLGLAGTLFEQWFPVYDARGFYIPVTDAIWGIRMLGFLGAFMVASVVVGVVLLGVLYGITNGFQRFKHWRSRPHS